MLFFTQNKRTRVISIHASWQSFYAKENTSKDCFYFDDDKIISSESTSFPHYATKLGHYKDQLVTVGGSDNAETEILSQSNGTLEWKLIESGPTSDTLWGEFSSTSNFPSNLTPTGVINRYSMVTIPESNVYDEFLLLLG